MSNRPDGFCASMPLPLFAAVMGLCGLAMVWHAVALRWPVPAGAAMVVTALAAMVFAALLVVYGCKWWRHRARVLEELTHPVRINFLPAISINLILLGLLVEHFHPGLAGWLWKTGAALQLLLTVVIVNIWLNRERPLDSLNPAWFIPAVGNVLVPLAAAPAGYPMVAWFFFSAGLFFWAVLGILVFYRLIVRPPLDPPMQPTLVVMLAPPAVAYLAWLAINGSADGLGHFFYCVALLTFLLLLPQIPRFFRLPYFPSWWAYTFPPAAFVSASFRFAEPGTPVVDVLLMLLSGLVTVLIVAVAVRTVMEVARGDMGRH